MAIFNKKKNKDQEQNKEPMFSPRVKGIAFFVFYIFFFMFFISYAGDLTQEAEQIKREEESNLPTYSIDMINEQNYKFKYTLTEENEITVIEGEKLLEKEKYTVNINNQIAEYFNNNGTVLINNGEWELYDSEEEIIPYSKLTDIKTINQLVKNSKFISKTEYAEKETVLEYQISTTTMVDILDNQAIDIADSPNTIKLYLDEEEVIKVELDITPYRTYQTTEEITTNYILEYNDFGTIEEIIK